VALRMHINSHEGSLPVDPLDMQISFPLDGDDDVCVCVCVYCVCKSFEIYVSDAPH